jgi:hypothetical protein
MAQTPLERWLLLLVPSFFLDDGDAGVACSPAAGDGLSEI